MSEVDPGPATDRPDEAERAVLVRWVATWQRAGAAMETHRRARLASMSVRDMQHSIQAIFGSLPTSIPRPSSGMVEMQRLFARLS